MVSQSSCLPLSLLALTLWAQPVRSLVQVIGFPRKTSESVVYQLSGTGFQDWNAVSVQRLLGGGGGGGECSLVFLTWWDGLRGGIGGFFSSLFFCFFCCEQLHKHDSEIQERPLANVLYQHMTFTRHKHVHLHTYCKTSHSLSHHFIVPWCFCVFGGQGPNIEFCTSVETFV